MKWHPSKSFLLGFLMGAITLQVVLLVLANLPDSKRNRQSRARASLHAMQAILVGLGIYKQDCGDLPTQEQGLRALASDPGTKGWQGPYVQPLPLDGWGRAFRYKTEGTEFELSSAGADGRFDTRDDIRQP